MNARIHHFLELLWGMTEKELRARYKYTILGFLWLLINPILQMIVIGFVFTFFMKEPVSHYYYYLFIGLLIWNFFSFSLTDITPSIVTERDLIKKSAFPRIIIPLSIIVSNLIHFFVAFVLLLLPVFFLKTMSIDTIPFVFAGLALLILFTTGISLMTCSIDVRFRDINFMVHAILIVWFYASPIVYSVTQIPNHILWLWQLNPLTSILQLFQHGILGSAAPTPVMLLSNCFVIALTTTVGFLIFRKENKTFDDWI